MSPAQPPTLSAIREAREQLGDAVRRTPTWRWQDPDRLAELAPGTELCLKLELLQYTGSFKPRGALLSTRAQDPAAVARGLVAVSAGNHALAVGFAARVAGTTATVVMPRSANPYRVQGCRRLGAQVVLVDDVHAAFAEVDRIVADEGRTFIHPFEGPDTALGTATVGLELMEAEPELDAVVVPIGGGGLCAGVAAAVKAVRPACRVFGVEPDGADTMHRSFAAGKPMAIDRVQTIADSLGAPHAAPYSFGLCRELVDELVRIDDDAMCRAMVRLFASMKLAVEPAGAAATAAVLGPLRSKLAGKRVGIIVCGANIDPAGFSDLLQRGLRSEAESAS